MKKFKVGDKVKLRYLSYHRVGITHEMLSMMKDKKRGVYVIRQLDKTGLGDEFAKLEGDLWNWSWPLEALELGDRPLNIDKVKGVRDPKRIDFKGVKKTRSEARPFSGTVVVAGRKLQLTWGADGRFYEGFNSPVDLVEAK